MMMKQKRTFFFATLLILGLAARLFSAPDDPLVTASGTLDWEIQELALATELNLASAGLRFPDGRSRAEETLAEQYLGLVRRLVFSVQVDSSSTVGDLVRSGDLDLRELDDICFAAKRVPPHFSADLTSLNGSYTLRLGQVSAPLIRHRQAAEPERPLLPSPAADYTGIIIIADAPLPIHGRNTSAAVTPCLFPKIWDSEMNLIYERNMTNPAAFTSGEKTLVHYTTVEKIFRQTPSGLDAELTALVGERPLRIFARSVFGTVPTDPVIDREDALIILSNENNRRLLREAKVVFVVNGETLKLAAENFQAE